MEDEAIGDAHQKGRSRNNFQQKMQINERKIGYFEGRHGRCGLLLVDTKSKSDLKSD